MEIVEEYSFVNDDNKGHSLQDDYLAALGVAMMFSKYGNAQPAGQVICRSPRMQLIRAQNYLTIKTALNG